MMLNYPFFPFRNKVYPNRYYNYPFYRYNYNMHTSIPERKVIKESINKDSTPHKENCEKKNKEKIENEQFFSILGIKLYFDDLIILTLLFFLYNEGVKDEGLFICLILLLLS